MEGVGDKRKRNEDKSVKEKEDTSKMAKKVAHGASQKRDETDYTLESGHIYFFYRPKVDVESAEAMGDVQKMYLVLKSQQPSKKNRVINVPKKKLPSSDTHERFWGYVSKVSGHVEDIGSILQEEHYDTKTLGERTVPEARPIGEGVYSIVKHHGGTRLAYVLEIPEHFGEVQKSMNVEKEATFAISVKNPEIVSKKDGPKAQYSQELIELFRGRKWMEVEPISLLDYEGTQILLVATSYDVVQTLGDEGKKLEEKKEKEVKEKKLDDKTLYKELHLKEHEDVAIPLKEGEWK